MTIMFPSQAWAFTCN